MPYSGCRAAGRTWNTRHMLKQTGNMPLIRCSKMYNVKKPSMSDAKQRQHQHIALRPRGITLHVSLLIQSAHQRFRIFGFCRTHNEKPVD